MTGKDERILIEMMEDLPNAIRYAPRGVRKKAEAAIAEIERQILARESPAESFEDFVGNPNNPLRKLHAALTEPPKVYSSALILWSLPEVTHVINRARTQLELTNFFENAPLVSVAFVGSPEKPKSHVYEVDGKKLIVHYVEFPGLQVCVNENQHVTTVSQRERASLTTKSTESWRKDYKGLAERVLGTSEETSTMLVKSFPDRDIRVLETAISSTYMATRAEYETGKYSDRSGEPSQE